MFKITEIKSWAKTWGYSIHKEKDNTINGASYYWMKNDDTSVCGVELSVSKVATAIFNHLTDNRWIEHQKQFQENNTEQKQFSVSDYGS